jgi:methylmalonyl-CoA/ethylmalonyl-CoA epimerase
MVIDHIGIVVKRLEEGIDQWTSLFGYKVVSDLVTNTRQKVRVVFLDKINSCMIKLIEPIDESSPVHKFALKGGGLHHLCFRCRDLSATIEQFKREGCRILVSPQPGEAFGNENIAFIYAKEGLNIELIGAETKACRSENENASL